MFAIVGLHKQWKGRYSVVSMCYGFAILEFCGSLITSGKNKIVRALGTRSVRLDWCCLRESATNARAHAQSVTNLNVNDKALSIKEFIPKRRTIREPFRYAIALQ